MPIARHTFPNPLSKRNHKKSFCLTDTKREAANMSRIIKAKDEHKLLRAGGAR